MRIPRLALPPRVTSSASSCFFLSTAQILPGCPGSACSSRLPGLSRPRQPDGRTRCRGHERRSGRPRTGRCAGGTSWLISRKSWGRLPGGSAGPVDYEGPDDPAGAGLSPREDLHRQRARRPRPGLAADSRRDRQVEAARSRDALPAPDGGHRQGRARGPGNEPRPGLRPRARREGLRDPRARLPELRGVQARRLCHGLRERLDEGNLEQHEGHRRLAESRPRSTRSASARSGTRSGGHNAIFTALFDPRIKVVVSSCGFNAFPYYYKGNIAGWSHKGYMPRLKERYGLDLKRVPFDWPELIGALAPRPSSRARPCTTPISRSRVCELPLGGPAGLRIAWSARPPRGGPSRRRAFVSPVVPPLRLCLSRSVPQERQAR